MIIKTIKELEKIFDELNKHFFNNKLEKPVILVQSKKKNILGTFSCNKVWENKKNKKDQKYEITLSAENLNRNTKGIISTLLHEMIHLYCETNNIKDTSNNGVYHNKRFKHESEARGLIITYDKTIGWSITKLKPETEKLIIKFKINDKAFDYYRKCFQGIKINKTKYHKYGCPECNLKLSCYKLVNLICGDCKKPLELRN